MSLNSKFISSALILGLNLSSLAANAQSHDFAQSQFRQDSEARLALVIPFGTERTDYKAQPRIAFSVRQYKQNDGLNNDWILKPGANIDFVENEFAMSLSGTPQFSLNGEAFYFADPEAAHVSDDVKTAGKIALGAGLVAVAVVGVGVLLILTDDCSDCDE